jgi:hypothetical protein
VTLASHRLDALGAALIARLEGARPAWGGAPQPAAEAMDAAFRDVVEPALVERARLLGEGAAADWCRAELRRSFAPRYLALAQEQSRLEAQFRRLRDPLGRILGAAAAVVAAFVLVRLLRGPAAVAVWPGLTFALFLPDLRAWWIARRYRVALQAVVDDLGRIQDSIEAHGAPAGEEPLR